MKYFLFLMTWRDFVNFLMTLCVLRPVWRVDLLWRTIINLFFSLSDLQIGLLLDKKFQSQQRDNLYLTVMGFLAVATRDIL